MEPGRGDTCFPGLGISHEALKIATAQPTRIAPIHVITWHKAQRAQGRTGGYPVDTAAPPDDVSTIPGKVTVISGGEDLEVFGKGLGEFRLMFGAIIMDPNRRVHLEGPSTIVIEFFTIAEIAITGGPLQQHLQVMGYNSRIHVSPVFVSKGQHEDIEKPPIVCGASRIAQALKEVQQVTAGRIRNPIPQPALACPKR